MRLHKPAGGCGLCAGQKVFQLSAKSNPGRRPAKEKPLSRCPCHRMGAFWGGSVLAGAWDGIRRGFGYGQFLTRFLIILLGLKAYDILFFDFFLLCHSQFFPHFYPEVKDIVGPQLFGYNWKTHLVQGIGLIAASAALAGISMLF